MAHSSEVQVISLLDAFLGVWNGRPELPFTMLDRRHSLDAFNGAGDGSELSEI
jgi:hypothetical protein